MSNETNYNNVEENWDILSHLNQIRNLTMSVFIKMINVLLKRQCRFPYFVSTLVMLS